MKSFWRLKHVTSIFPSLSFKYTHFKYIFETHILFTHFSSSLLLSQSLSLLAFSFLLGWAQYTAYIGLIRVSPNLRILKLTAKSSDGPNMHVVYHRHDCVFPICGRGNFFLFAFQAQRWESAGVRNTSNKNAQHCC